MGSQEGVDERERRPERVDVEEGDLCDGSEMVGGLLARFELAFEVLHKVQHFAALGRFRVHSSEAQKEWIHGDHRSVVHHQEMGFE